MAEKEVTPQPDENKQDVTTTGATEKPAISLTPDSSPDSSTKINEQNFEVRLNSYKIVSALGITAVHNEVAFYKDGKAFLSFNGNAYHNQTGEFKTFATSTNHTLRVSASPLAIEQIKEDHMQLVGSVTLEKLTADQLLDKIHDAAMASNFINDNKLEYVIIGGRNYEAQNSNSVATSLVRAMGYEYPEKEFSHLFAPGSKRNLLPDDWSVNDITVDGLSSANRLDPKRVQQEIKDEKNPYPHLQEWESPYPNLFNPNTTTVPYVKKGQELKAPPEPPPKEEVEDAEPEVTPEEIPEEDKPVEEEPEDENETPAGFQSAAEPAIQCAQNLTGSFSEACANTPILPTPDQGREITIPALQQKTAANTSSYLNNGTNGP